MVRSPLVCPGAFLLAIFLTGCATVAPLDSSQVLMDCTRAIATVRESPDKDNRNKELLYYMQLATYQHICREYSQSVANFERAKRIEDQLYGTSVTGAASSFLVNDARKAYKGQNFERAFLRMFNAMNYSILGEQESALVEARQTDFLLSKLNREQGGKNVYDEDAFGRMLTGMLYQEAGDIDNANVSYLKALEAYRDKRDSYGVPIPEPLLASATQVAQAHSPRAVERVAKFGTISPRKLPEGAGEVILFHQAGLVPRKVETRILIAWNEGFPYLSQMSTNQSDAETRRTIDAAATIVAADSITVSFPKFVPRSYSVKSIGVEAPGALSISSPSLVQDIGKIAMKDLDDHKSRIYAKTLARAAFYYATLKLLEKKMRDEDKPEFMIQVAKAAEKIRQIAFEKADTRQWESLPDKIKLISIVLPAGEHTIKIHHAGQPAGNPVPPIDDLIVQVHAGKRTFASIRTAL